VSREDRVEQLRGEKMLDEAPWLRFYWSTERKAWTRRPQPAISQQFPDLPIILISAHSKIPERVLWLVDENVMKSEMPEGLVRVVERATHRRLTPAA